MKELFTLYYHRRILFTDFFSQSQQFIEQKLEKTGSDTLIFLVCPSLFFTVTQEKRLQFPCLLGL